MISLETPLVDKISNMTGDTMLGLHVKDMQKVIQKCDAHYLHLRF